MPDSNPSLTSTLKMLRDGLLLKRTQLLEELESVRVRIEQTTLQVEAADTLILAHDPDHVAVDLRGEGPAVPMVVRQRPLQLTSEQPDAGRETDDPAAAALDDVEQEPGIEGQPPVDETPPEEAEAPVEAAAETAPPARPTAEKSPPRQPEQKLRKTKAPSAGAKKAITEYFSRINRNDVILDILSRSEAPIRAAEITKTFKEEHPIDTDDQDVKTMLATRLSATLYALEASGRTVRTAKAIEGKADEIYWTIDPVHKAERKRQLQRTKRPYVRKPVQKPISETADEGGSAAGSGSEL